MNEHHGQGMGGHQRSWRGRESIIPDHAAAFEHLEFERVRQSEFETPNVGCNSHACRTMVPCPECLQDGVVGKVLLLQPGNNYYKIKLLNVITVPGLLAELTHHSADRSANVRWKPWQRPLYHWHSPKQAAHSIHQVQTSRLYRVGSDKQRRKEL